MAAAADAHRRGPDLPPERQQPVDSNIVVVRNDSGSDLRRYDVVGLGTANTKLLTLVDRDQVWLIADKLTNCLPNCQVAVLLDPLLNGKYGYAQVSGRGVAYVNVGAVWHRRARPTKAADVAVSGLFGPLEILRTPDGTGEKLCYVSIGHSGNRGMFAKTTSEITAGSLSSGRLVLGSGTATIYDPYSTATQYADASHTATIYNMPGEAIPSGTFVSLTPTDDWLPLAEIEPCTAPVEPS
jgi:hypothetical protein